jgi:hypothetical protein
VQNVASPIRTNSEPISDVFGTGVPQLTQAYLETSISDVSDWRLVLTSRGRRSRLAVGAVNVRLLAQREGDGIPAPKDDSCARSTRRLAPVHPYDLAGDVGRFARRDEDDSVGDLGGRRAPLQRNSREERRFLLG